MLKNSGALKDTCKLKKCVAALDITHYVLPKITGTRFINHRRRGFERLLHMWPVFLTAYESALAENKQKAETAAKIQGLLSKIQNVQILYKVCVYLDILEKIGPSSMVFEGEGLLPCEIGSSLKLTYSGLDDITEASESGEVSFNNFLRYFDISQTETQGEINVFTISRQYPKQVMNCERSKTVMHGAN